MTYPYPSRQVTPIARPRFENNYTDERFFIGTVGEKRFFTNLAVDHRNGLMTNERLLSMPDIQLKEIAYGKPNLQDQIKTELYKRPSESKMAESQGGMRGEEYVGVHRAWVILAFRKEKAMADAIQKGLNKKNDDREAIESLISI